MGLIYNPTESQELINAMTLNIRLGRAMTQYVNSRTTNLITVLDGSTVGGQAYDAGKALFEEVIKPTIVDTEEAVDRIEQQLNWYIVADDEVGYELLDEEKVIEAYLSLEAQASLIMEQIDDFRILSRTYAKNNLSSLSMMYDDLRYEYDHYLSILEAEQRTTKEKLYKLYDFNDAVSGLFKNNLADMEKIRRSLVLLEIVTFNPHDPELVINEEMVMAFEREFGIKLTDKLTNPMTWVKKAISESAKATKKQVFVEGKNVGGVLSLKLQAGKFSHFRPVQYMSKVLAQTPHWLSTGLGYGAKAVGVGLIAWSAWDTFNEYNDKYQNTGRGLVYSGFSTYVGIKAGIAGATIGTTIAGWLIGAEVIAGAGFVAFAAPIVGAIVVGVGASVAIKAAYDHVPFFKDSVDFAGDVLNAAGNEIEKAAMGIGDAWNSSLHAMKRCFGW